MKGYYRLLVITLIRVEKRLILGILIGIFKIVLSKQILASHTTKTNLSLTESELTLTIRNVKNKTEYVIYIVEDGFYLIGTKK